MASDWTTVGANTALDATITGTLYFAACTTEPTTSSTGSTIVEPGGGGYARVSFNASTVYDAASGGSKAMNQNVSFSAASGANWGTIVSIAICTAASAGNVLAWITPASSDVINDGDTLTVTGFTVTAS